MRYGDEFFLKKKSSGTYYLLGFSGLMGKKPMKKDNIIQEKSLAFAIAVLAFCRYLKENKREYVVSKQLIRSGTAIGANLEEGIGSQSGRDFYYRISVAYKEARESMFWLKILNESRYAEAEKIDPLICSCDEILRILGSILKTLRQKNQ
jgi:four helix bundle protein